MLIISLATATIETKTIYNYPYYYQYQQLKINPVLEIINGIFFLIILLPNFCLMIRRFHDIGKSGWNLLWILIPIVGFCILIYFFCLDSQPGDNQYGPSPKYVINNENNIPMLPNQNNGNIPLNVVPQVNSYPQGYSQPQPNMI